MGKCSVGDILSGYNVPWGHPILYSVEYLGRHPTIGQNVPANMSGEGKPHY